MAKQRKPELDVERLQHVLIELVEFVSLIGTTVGHLAVKTGEMELADEYVTKVEQLGARLTEWTVK